MRIVKIIALLILSGCAIAETTYAGKSHPETQNPAVRGATVQLLSPSQGERVEGPSISIHYNIMGQKHVSSRTPTFLVQLDSETPVETSETTYSVDHLLAGEHAVTVSLVDSRHHPIQGSRAQLTFVCAESSPTEEVKVEPMLPASLQKVAIYLPQVAAPVEPPDGSGEMPLLSVIGLGVLVGGMVSAMKTRP